MRDYEGEVEFISIAGRDDLPAMRAFVERHGLDGVMPHVADTDGSVWGRFEVSGQPMFVFISADGDTERVFGALSEQELRVHLDLLEGR